MGGASSSPPSITATVAELRATGAMLCDTVHFHTFCMYRPAGNDGRGRRREGDRGLRVKEGRREEMGGKRGGERGKMVQLRKSSGYGDFANIYSEHRQSCTTETVRYVCLTLGEQVQFIRLNRVPRDVSQFIPTLCTEEHLLLEVPVVVIHTPQLNWEGEG